MRLRLKACQALAATGHVVAGRVRWAGHRRANALVEGLRLGTPALDDPDPAYEDDVARLEVSTGVSRCVHGVLTEFAELAFGRPWRSAHLLQTPSWSPIESIRTGGLDPLSELKNTSQFRCYQMKSHDNLGVPQEKIIVVSQTLLVFQSLALSHNLVQLMHGNLLTPFAAGPRSGGGFDGAFVAWPFTNF